MLVDSTRRDAAGNQRSQVAVELDALPVGVTHLLAADDALDEQFQCGVYTAVCGQLVRTSDLPSWECPEDCGCDLAVYLPAVRAPGRRVERRGPACTRRSRGRRQLRELKAIRSDRVADAFLAPSHLFVAREPLEKAYAANIPWSPRGTSTAWPSDSAA